MAGTPAPPTLLHAATCLVAMRCGSTRTRRPLGALPPRRLLQMCEAHPPLLVFAADGASGRPSNAGRWRSF